MGEPGDEARYTDDVRHEAKEINLQHDMQIARSDTNAWRADMLNYIAELINQVKLNTRATVALAKEIAEERAVTAELLHNPPPLLSLPEQPAQVPEPEVTEPESPAPVEEQPDPLAAALD